MSYMDKPVTYKKIPRDMKGWERKEWEERNIYKSSRFRDVNGMTSPICHDGNGYRNLHEC